MLQALLKMLRPLMGGFTFVVDYQGQKVHVTKDGQPVTFTFDNFIREIDRLINGEKEPPKGQS